LGDDIVIFDPRVAERYCALLQGFGMPINKSKSVCATNSTFEFAKVTGSNMKNVSAISWKMFISQNTMMGRVNIAHSLLGKDLYRHPISALRNIVRKTKNHIGT
jgi:hypothetical protein